jgi:hypothetical protein
MRLPTRVPAPQGREENRVPLHFAKNEMLINLESRSRAYRLGGIGEGENRLLFFTVAAVCGVGSY